MLMLRAGVCYHLYSTEEFDRMPDHAKPEFLCTPLQELCLQTKLLDETSSVSNFFLQAPNPPLVAVVDTAVSLLKVCQSNADV